MIDTTACGSFPFLPRERAISPCAKNGLKILLRQRTSQGAAAARPARKNWWCREVRGRAFLVEGVGTLSPETEGSAKMRGSMSTTSSSTFQAPLHLPTEEYVPKVPKRYGQAGPSPCCTLSILNPGLGKAAERTRNNKEARRHKLNSRSSLRPCLLCDWRLETR